MDSPNLPPPPKENIIVLYLLAIWLLKKFNKTILFITENCYGSNWSNENGFIGSQGQNLADLARTFESANICVV